MNKEVIKYPLILGAVVAIATLVLGLVYYLTQPIIEQNYLMKEEREIIELFPNATITTLDVEFNEEETTAGLQKVLKADENYIYKFTVKGFKEGFSFLIVINENGEFSNFKVVDSAGESFIFNVLDESYQNLFLNKDHSFDFDEELILSGTTFTSTAVSNAVIVSGKNYGRLK